MCFLFVKRGHRGAVCAGLLSFPGGWKGAEGLSGVRPGPSRRSQPLVSGQRIHLLEDRTSMVNQVLGAGVVCLLPPA